MKNFKNYLQTQLNIIEIKLKGIITEIENIPAPSKVDITSYGNKEQIKKEYQLNEKLSVFKRIIGPSMNELQIFVRKRELKRLNTQKQTYEIQISQIKNALPFIEETCITGQIYPNEVIIREMIQYASTRNINPQELLQFLVDICIHSKDTDKITDKIMKNITNFFDSNCQLLKNAKISTLNLLFEKLFMKVFKEKELEEYRLVINQLYTQLKIEKDRLNKVQSKPELELQRRALIELQDYINGNIIIRTLDIENFQLLLETANIDKYTSQNLIAQMEEKIIEERIIIEREKALKAMKKFLSEEELDLIRQAETKEKLLTGPLKDLVVRAKKDIISMCKYLDLFDHTDNVHEALEILNDRTKVLKNILENLNEEKKEQNILFYITDNEGIPLFLRNLELHHISTYGTIYNLLYKVGIGNKGKKVFEKDNIEFYGIGHNILKIVFVELSGKRIVIGIDSHNPTYTIKSIINNEMIKKIRDIEHRSFNPTFQEIHATYESVILEALNVKEIGYSLTLKKKDE